MTAFSAPAFPSPQRRASGQTQLHPPRPAPYLRVPERLLRTYAHDPLTVGVYLAVARCAVAQQRSVPLSPADLAAWAGGEHERDAGIMRRIRRLTDDGWLVAEAGRAVKARLRPAWGPAVPWNFAAAQQGKPNAVRTCRVPLELFDSYLGRLEPKAGRTPALVTRYFDRPLLDLLDLGSYALVVAGFALPTERLGQLALVAGVVPLAPQPLSELLGRAVAGELRLDPDETAPPVAPSLAGWRRLGFNGPPPGLEGRNGSPNGSLNGSDSAPQRITHVSQPELPFTALECASETIKAAAGAYAWDSRNERKESTNPPPPDSGGMGGGRAAPDSSLVLPLPTAAHELDPALHADQHESAQGCGGEGNAAHIPAPLGDPAAGNDGLDPAVRDGHAALNAERAIRPGEWLELEQFQFDYGAERLLVWQARAARAERDPARGIVPAYYVACAADEACALITPGADATSAAGASITPDGQTIAATPPLGHQRLLAADAAAAPELLHLAEALPLTRGVQDARDTHQDRPAASALGGDFKLDPACDELLQAMGVRRRAALAGVPYALVSAWHEAVQHPGMAARFADPVAFAVSQLAAHVAPPTRAELERWAAWQAQGHRNASPQLIAPSEPPPVIEETAWAAHARALRPDADANDLTLLTSLLIQGATDDEALALLAAQRAYEAQGAGAEVTR